MTCKCECHTFHLIECGECLDNHHSNYNHITNETTFTDSYVVDMISEYFHRYALPADRLGTFYYELIFSNMITDKTTNLQSSRMIYLNYLFKYRKRNKIYKLIHRGIMQFLSRNGLGDITRDFDDKSKLKWKLVI